MASPAFDLLWEQAKVARFRRDHPLIRLDGAAELADAALEVLIGGCDQHDIAWIGRGAKQYRVFCRSGTDMPFSRPINVDLFINDRSSFRDRWNAVRGALGASGGVGRLRGFEAEDFDRVLYTAALAYAAASDLALAGRGSPGTYFELLIGPIISQLSGRPEGGAVILPVTPTFSESINVDLTFPLKGKPTLVVPTKLTTRERIVQAFVHQRILETSDPGGYISVLCASSENNVLAKKGTTAPRSPAQSQLTDTLVPKTIALYQKYVAELGGLYYLDPPQPYIDRVYDGLPVIGRLSTFVIRDLSKLLS